MQTWPRVPQHAFFQGALFGVRALARGVGPLVFSALFHYFSREPHYHPSAPLWGLTLVSAAGAAVAFFVHVPESADGTVKAAVDGDQEALLAGSEATPSPKSAGTSSGGEEERARARAASVQLSSWYAQAKMPESLGAPPQPQTASSDGSPTRVSLSNRQTSASLSRRKLSDEGGVR